MGENRENPNRSTPRPARRSLVAEAAQAAAAAEKNRAEAFDAACEKLRGQLDAGAPAEVLERSYAAATEFKMAVPPELESRYRRAITRRAALGLTQYAWHGGAVLLALCLAAVALWAVLSRGQPARELLQLPTTTARPAAPATKPAIARPVAMPIVAKPLPPATRPAVASVPIIPDPLPADPIPPPPITAIVLRVPVFSGIANFAADASDPALPNHWTTASVVFPNGDTRKFESGEDAQRESFSATTNQGNIVISRSYMVPSALGLRATQQKLTLSPAVMETGNCIHMVVTGDHGADQIAQVLKLTRIDIADGNRRYSLSWQSPPVVIPAALGSDANPPSLPSLVGGAEAFAVLEPPAANTPPGWTWKSGKDGTAVAGTMKDHPECRLEVSLGHGHPPQITNTYRQTLTKLKDAEQECLEEHRAVEMEMNTLSEQLLTALPANGLKLRDQMGKDQAKWEDTARESKAITLALRAFEGLGAQAFDIPVVLKNGTPIATIHVGPTAAANESVRDGVSLTEVEASIGLSEE